MAATHLDDFARELRQIGEVGFRRRYATPVLIVTGRATGAGRSGTEAVTRRTAGQRRAAWMSLIHRVFPIAKSGSSSSGPVSVGRTADNDVVIPEVSVSKRHCTFELGDGAMTIVDAGSTNGTLLNGSRLRAHAAVPLCGGESITVGRFTLVFETPAGFLELVSGLVKK